jgi:NTP pyrophosphatase (non-canonical NTP hydrolase)
MNMYSRFVASRINKELTPAESLGSAFLGLVCEAGEAGDIIKKYLYQGQPLDREKLLRELGDVRFYLEWCCQLLRTSVPEIEELNIEKLEKRYPTGFVANVKRGDK